MTKAEFASMLEATYAQIQATLDAWDELAPGTFEIEEDFDIAESALMLQMAVGESDGLDEEIDGILASHQFS